MGKFIACCVMVLCFVGSTKLSALPSEEYVKQIVELLRPRADEFESFGEVAEELTRRALVTEYPEHEYEMVQNLLYFNHQGVLIGELDIVVIERASQQVVMVAEVKAGQPDKAVSAAREQKARFEKSLRRNRIKRIARRDNRKIEYDIRQFESQLDFRIVGIRDYVRNNAYDSVLDISKDELKAIFKGLKRVPLAQAKTPSRPLTMFPYLPMCQFSFVR
jgi:hypothetical protein